MVFNLFMLGWFLISVFMFIKSLLIFSNKIYKDAYKDGYIKACTDLKEKE